MSTPLTISYEQALYFRAIRGFLAGPGPPGGAAEATLQVARAMVGVQSQQLGPSCHGVCMRAAQRPTAAAIKSALLAEPERRVVRTWSQRETIHLLDAADWPVVVAARKSWASAGLKNLQPTEADLAIAAAAVAELNRPITRSDLTPALSDSFMQRVRPQIEKNAKYLFKTTPSEAQLDAEVRRFCAGLLLRQLCGAGVLSAGDKLGKEQAYAPRAHWFPQLPWPDLDLDEANRRLIRRYLSVAAPATARDIAHFFNAPVGHVRRWLTQLAGELVSVSCGGKKGLVALAEDADASSAPVPADADWPVRLLPMWDGMMMTHADKTWTLPDTTEHKLVWRRAAVVAPGARGARAGTHRGNVSAQGEGETRGGDGDAAEGLGQRRDDARERAR